MRIVQNIVLVIVFIASLVLAAANFPTLMNETSLQIPLMGVIRIKARLFGLIALPAIAALYTFLGSMQGLGANARSANYLKQIDGLRQSLDKEEAGRFKALQTSLDSHAKNILGKLETPTTPVSSPDPKANERALLSFNARVDKLRDELAAEIAHSEENLRQRLDAAIISSDKRK